MSDLEIVLMISLGVMICLWYMERRRAYHTFIVARMFHHSLIRLAKKELTLSIDADDQIKLKEVGTDKSITIC